MHRVSLALLVPVLAAAVTTALCETDCANECSDPQDRDIGIACAGCESGHKCRPDEMGFEATNARPSMKHMEVSPDAAVESLTTRSHGGKQQTPTDAVKSISSSDGANVASVLRLTWPADGYVGLVSLGRPALIEKGTAPSAAWRAHTHWRNRSYLVEHAHRVRVFERAKPAVDDADEVGARSFAYFSHADGNTGMRAPHGDAAAAASTPTVTRHVRAAANRLCTFKWPCIRLTVRCVHYVRAAGNHERGRFSGPRRQWRFPPLLL